MLKHIKSSYFAKIIFSFVDEQKKLEIIKYNRNLQKQVDININNYKIFCGKYIVIETKGKEYNIFNNELLFKGAYLNGKRNGKGKEYKNGELIFEGEYLNGKRNGKGKEYDINGKVIFEGEYINGVRWTGKVFNLFNNKIYELNNGKGCISE